MEDEHGAYQINPENFNGELFGGVVFPQDFDFLDPGQTVPELRYTLRFGYQFSNSLTELIYPIFQLSGPGNAWNNYADFVLFQNLIDLAYIEVATGERMLPRTIGELGAMKWVKSVDLEDSILPSSNCLSLLGR